MIKLTYFLLAFLLVAVQPAYSENTQGKSAVYRSAKKLKVHKRQPSSTHQKKMKSKKTSKNQKKLAGKLAGKKNSKKKLKKHR